MNDSLSRRRLLVLGARSVTASLGTGRLLVHSSPWYPAMPANDVQPASFATAA
jgi:hypothetical protein